MLFGSTKKGVVWVGLVLRLIGVFKDLHELGSAGFEILITQLKEFKLKIL